MLDRGAVTRSRKGNKANVERKVGDSWQWRATGQCSKGNSCGFNHGAENEAYLVNKRSDRPLLHHIRRQPKAEQKNQNHLTKN